jgi:hypothetical protein
MIIWSLNSAATLFLSMLIAVCADLADHRSASSFLMKSNTHSSSQQRSRALPTYQVEQPIHLRCTYSTQKSYTISKGADVTVQDIADFKFKPSLIYFYDADGNKRAKPHMWVATNVSYMCTYHLQDMIVSKLGAILTSTEVAIDWSDRTVLGRS